MLRTSAGAGAGKQVEVQGDFGTFVPNSQLTSGMLILTPLLPPASATLPLGLLSKYLLYLRWVLLAGVMFDVEHAEVCD